MYKALLAIIVAAACAAVFVGFIPPPAPAFAAIQTEQRNVVRTATSETSPRSLDSASAACAQAWPYYEASCLRDSRRQNGKAAVVRVVAAGKPATTRIQQAHH